MGDSDLDNNAPICQPWKQLLKGKILDLNQRKSITLFLVIGKQALIPFRYI